MQTVVMNAVKKLTLKTIGVQEAATKLGANAKLGNVPEGQKLLLCRMYGICIGFKQIESDMGLSNKLIGEFEGVRISDGALFGSNICYLPGSLDTAVLVQLSNGASSVSFAFDIFAEPDLDSRSARGYKYIGSTAIQPTENDPLAQLRQGLLPAGSGKHAIAASASEEEKPAGSDTASPTQNTEGEKAASEKSKGDKGGKAKPAAA
jgi:hypothetical protein